MKKIRSITTAWMTLLLLTACDSSPKAIPENGQGEQHTSGIFSEGQDGAAAGVMDPAAEKDLHTVEALEALPTTKYVYVRVKEGEQEFWIATVLQEITIGRKYFYRGGLLKTNFESKEYKRTFDRLYLISQLVPVDHGSGMNEMGGEVPSATAPAPLNNTPLPALDVTGITKISDVMAEPRKFAGKTIQVSGTCTKVNPNIMGRNWIHVQDGGKGARELVVTTSESVAEGQKVTVIGKVAVDMDFGAGYKYEVLLEGGRLAPPM